MITLPKSTEFNRRIPKQKFYDNLIVTNEMKRIFIDQINSIQWRNKISPTTVNVAEGVVVVELEIIEIRLNQPTLDKRVLQLIDKQIPYHILFLLVFEEKTQAWIGYKEQSQSQSKASVFRAGTYYHTEWQPINEVALRLDGLNMDAVYEGFICQVAGERLASSPSGDLKYAVIRDERRQKLLREIALQENKVRLEKQFNVQVVLNGEMRRLKKELEDIENG